ncbi:hypothetical protein [Deinococcus peraridilitoris]|uniref:Uncharacterized protein n=1 Tax=Deinococcus peraridilitoris (strain DSM 19664 / LMG 22246 / CIP 109416 / KR-200) TaxID=937777 RepID=L0A4Z2_DEIPD|nr:hypothetical protein [Deinococcus peraridilitoris]AFZ68931.1 hypothetical protein Deipe_3498 [Deinococcus peraridilitoris DSM 19664]
MEIRPPTVSGSTRPFSFYPRGKIFGVLADLEAVRVLAGQLMALGCGDEKIEILEGEGGAHTLDSDGRHHGLIARFVRYLQGMTEERGQLEHYVHELLMGRYVVCVTLSRGTSYQEVCKAFTMAGASSVHFYGPFVVEHVRA